MNWRVTPPRPPHSGIYRNGASDTQVVEGHTRHFEDCPHADCVLVRSPLPASPLHTGAEPAFSENETKDVLAALYQDGHVDLVLADRVAALMKSSSIAPEGSRD